MWSTIPSSGGKAEKHPLRKPPFAAAHLLLTPYFASVLLLAGIIPLYAASSAPPPIPSMDIQLAGNLGRQAPGYHLFTNSLHLPVISQSPDGTLLLNHKTALSSDVRQLDAFCLELGIPSPILSAVIRRSATNPQSRSSLTPAQLQLAVADYKYLVDKWSNLHLTNDPADLKTRALALLNQGELDQVWAILLQLPRPPAPTGLRIVH